MAQLADELLARLHRLARSEGVELVAVEVGGTARRPRVCLVLDRQDGGVTLRDCEAVSRQASLLFDEADPFPGPYTLEVSSPGIDRKLYGPHDYQRFSGRAVRLRLRGQGGKRQGVEGFLLGLEGGVVHLRTPGGEEIAVAEAEIFEARLNPLLEERVSTQAARASGPRRRDRGTSKRA
jgi:ribosome maturation factor RimP